MFTKGFLFLLMIFFCCTLQSSSWYFVLCCLGQRLFCLLDLLLHFTNITNSSWMHEKTDTSLWSWGLIVCSVKVHSLWFNSKISSDNFSLIWTHYREQEKKILKKHLASLCFNPNLFWGSLFKWKERNHF